MKRRLMLAAMSLILTVTLSVTSMNTVAEASPKMSPTEENLEITINSFLESDGAVAEELTDEMLKTFLETPLDFLRVIDTYPLDKQELLLSRIANVAVGMPDEERLSFEDIIYSADETTPGTATGTEPVRPFLSGKLFQLVLQCLFIIDGFPQFLFAFFQLPIEFFQL